MAQVIPHVEEGGSGDAIGASCYWDIQLHIESYRTGVTILDLVQRLFDVVAGPLSKGKGLYRQQFENGDLLALRHTTDLADVLDFIIGCNLNLQLLFDHLFFQVASFAIQRELANHDHLDVGFIRSVACFSPFCIYHSNRLVCWQVCSGISGKQPAWQRGNGSDARLHALD
jgi:hypothetical protein